jgi:hypothetical protein
MDAYSISYTSPLRRNSSKIYQDLRLHYLHSLTRSDKSAWKQLTAMEGFMQVNLFELWEGIQKGSFVQ